MDNDRKIYDVLIEAKSDLRRGYLQNKKRLRKNKKITPGTREYALEQLKKEYDRIDGELESRLAPIRERLFS